MQTLITKRPSGNSNQRRQAWRRFKAEHESLGYVCKRKRYVKDARLGGVINTLFIAKLKT